VNVGLEQKRTSKQGASINIVNIENNNTVRIASKKSPNDRI
jgi:hypothetical protein